MLQCAKCPTFVCRAGDREHGPEYCPMHAVLPSFEKLYGDPEVQRWTHRATLVEGVGYRRWSRAEEVMEVALRVGTDRLGLAFCQGVEQETEVFRKVLEANGFQVVMPPLESVSRGCQPQTQAELCNREKTGLNVMLGMCVGHDSLFIRKSEAPVAALFPRDKVLAHNPVAALYGSKTYFADRLYHGHQPPAPRSTTVEVSAKDLAETYHDPEARRLALAAAWVDRAGQGQWTRVEETIEFARRLGAKRLGLAFCGGSRQEAKLFTEVLEANGFEVPSICCKSGAIPKEALGIADAEKVRPGRPEMMCNPVFQATMLNEAQPDLNIVMGQCVGHDATCLKFLQGPVTYLVAKDRVLAHNAVGALYQSDSYFHAALYEAHKRPAK